MSSNEFVAAKGVIVVENDPGNASAFSKVEGDAKRMAKTVADGSKAAGDAVGKIGENAGKSGADLDRSTKSMISSIQRATAAFEAGGTSSSKYFEAIAKQRNISGDALKPYIEQLRQAEDAHRKATGATVPFNAALHGVGDAANLTTQQMQGLVHSARGVFDMLASGQSPLRAFAVEGGKLTGTFGSIGAAASAVGGAVVGLVNPLALAALAIGGLTVGAALGASEFREFQSALKLSGNAVGLSISQYTLLRQELGAIGTQSKAADALLAIAKNGGIASQSVKTVGEAAIRMAQATGQSVESVVAQFAELGKTPAESAAKLNDTYNFLTAATYRQIKALEDQGRTTDAAKVATDSFADAVKARSKDVIENVGFMEAAWKGLVGVINGGVEAAKNIGRPLSTVQQLALVQGQIRDRQGLNSNRPFSTPFDTPLPDLERQQAELNRQLLKEQEIAIAKGEQARQTKAEIAFSAIVQANLTKREQLEQEINRIREKGVDAGRSQLDIDRQIANARQRFAETGGLDALAGIRAAAVTAQQTIDLLRGKLDTGDIGGLTKLTEAEVKVNQIEAKLKTTVDATTRAHLAQALAVAQNTVSLEKQAAAVTLQYEAWKKSLGILDAQTNAVEDQARAIEDQAAAQENVNVNFGKSKTAIEQATLAQLKLQLAEDGHTDQFIAALNRKTEAQKRYVEALQQAEFIQERQRLVEASRQTDETTATLALEVSLLGVSQTEREKILAQRRVEVALAKELAGIEKLNLGTGPEADAKREELRAQARANALKESQNAAAQIVIAEWQRAADSINASLTGAISDWVMSGKSLAKGLAQAFEREFDNLVLRPTISALLSSTGITGLLTSATSSVTGSIGSALGLAGLGKSAAGFLGIGGAPAASTTATGAAAAFIPDVEATALAAAPVPAAAGGLSGLLGAVPGWGWAALGVAALLGLGSKSHGPKTDSVAGTGLTALGSSSSRDDSFATTALSGVQAQFDQLAASFGIKAATQFGIGVSRDPKGTAPTFLEVNAQQDGQSIYHSLDRNVGRDDAALQAASSAAITEAIFSALQHSDLAQPFKDFFDGVKDASAEAKQTAIKQAQDVVTYTAQFGGLAGVFSQLSTLSVSARAGIVTLAGSLQTLTDATATYFQNFYTAAEQRAATVKTITTQLDAAGANFSTDAIASMTRAQFRAFVDGLDLTTQEGQKLYVAAVQVSGAFAGITDALDAVGGAATSAADNMKAVTTLLQGDTDAAFKTLQQVVNQQLTGAQAAQQAAQQNVDTLTNIFGIIDSGVKTLYGQVSSTSAQQVAQSRAFISQALGTAQKTGYLPDATDLQNAIQTASGGISADKFSSQFALDRERLTLAGQLSGLQGITGKELTVAQKQLDASKAQVAYLEGILSTSQAQVDALRNGFTTLADALKAFAASFAVEQRNAPGGNQVSSLYQQLLGRAPDASGFQFYSNQLSSGMTIDQVAAEFRNSPEFLKLTPLAVGMERVPYDGFPALLHKDEAVLTSSQAGAWRAGDGGGSVATEIRALRESVEAIGRAQVSAATKLQKLHEAWDGDGLPETRSVA